MYLRRGSVKLRGPHDWKTTRKWLGDTGRAQPKQHMHHALIPNNRWGKSVPDVDESAEPQSHWKLHHTRIHGQSLKFGLPRFNAVERYWHGTSSWWKAAIGSAVGHAAQAVADHLPHHAPPVGPGYRSQKK